MSKPATIVPIAARRSKRSRSAERVFASISEDEEEAAVASDRTACSPRARDRARLAQNRGTTELRRRRESSAGELRGAEEIADVAAARRGHTQSSRAARFTNVIAPEDSVVTIPMSTLSSTAR